ncbi:MAG: pyridoxal-phosphate dependent enzyme [Chloroflexi bacterium]|nr:pyridoxal-phosphate dependent enzyme [Chloroflexota bacterium]
MIPLFRHYPLLSEKVPHVSLGGFPTPVQKLDHLARDTGINQLYIKRDDLSGKLYGGNKIRKFEFILGHALHSGIREVLTFGFAGANHALATAVTAQQVGLRSISMMMPEPQVPYVCSNLLMTYYCGAELYHQQSKQMLILATAYQLIRHKMRNSRLPLFISGRGTSPLGTIGFVNAAFELKEQVMSGELPEPDYIYVAKGSGGTTAGLMLGIKAAKLKSRVVSVSAKDEKEIDAKKMGQVCDKTALLLHSLDPSFPKLECSDEDLDIRHDFVGRGYACPTEEGLKAISLMEKNEGIRLDTTYTGKAFACLLDDAGKGDLRDKVVLFWNTYNSRDFSDAIAEVDYHRLPRGFHRYFERKGQPSGH